MIRIGIFVATLVAASFSTVGKTQETTDPGVFVESPPVSPASVKLSAAQLFELADEARSRRDFITEDSAYRAPTKDLDIEPRTAARCRLGMMLADDPGTSSDAGLELRRFTDNTQEVA